MIIPEKLRIGDMIGVVAPSNPIINENIEEIERAKEIIEKLGFKVKFSKNLFSNKMDIVHQQKKRLKILMKYLKIKM